MPQFTRWDRPRGAVHDVAKALEYGSEGCNVLVLSDAALYVVQNLFSLDVEFTARWADEAFEHGFLPIHELSPSYPDWLDMIGRIQAEVVPMTCDLVSSLEAIEAAISGCCTLQADILARLMTGLETDVSGEYLETHPYYDPPSGYLSPPENEEALCARCWSFVTNWRESNIEARHQASELGQIGVGLITIIFAALSLPFTVVLLIIASIVEVALEIDETTFNTLLTNASSDLACALFTASNSATAVTQARGVIDGISGLNDRAKAMLKAQITYGALDSIYNETYPIRAGMPTDCSACESIACEDVFIDEFADNTLPLWEIIEQGSNIASVGCDDGSARVVANSGGSSATNLVTLRYILPTPWEIQPTSVIQWRRKTSDITSQYLTYDLVSNPGYYYVASGSGSLSAAQEFVTMQGSISANVGEQVRSVRWSVSKTTGPYTAWLNWVKVLCSAP